MGLLFVPAAEASGSEVGQKNIITVMTHFRNSSRGTSLFSLGTSLGLRSCCVLDGLDVYGRSCGGALHS